MLEGTTFPKMERHSSCVAKFKEGVEVGFLSETILQIFTKPRRSRAQARNRLFSL